MKNECCIVRDLLPLYIENITSDETAVFVRKHLEKCAECSAELEAMQADNKLFAESDGVKEQRMREAAVLSRIERSLRKDKVIAIAVTAICIIFFGVLGFIFWTDIKDRSMENYEKKEAEKVADGTEWIKKTNTEEIRYRKLDGEYLTLEDVIRISEKGDGFSWKDLQEYNFYEILSDDYLRIYEIEDYDRLFALQVSWAREGEVELPLVIDPVEEMELLETLLVAGDGQNTGVDLRSGDVKAYIEGHQDNPSFQTFDFTYFPAEVKGTSETLEKFAELREGGEEYIISDPEEIAAVKIDSQGELNTFAEKMQYELKYTDHEIGENVYVRIGRNVGSLTAEPQFILYIPQGNLTHEYHVTNMERCGEDLYISIEKTPRTDQDVKLDGCLIGLSIMRDDIDTASVKGVTRVHVEMNTPDN